MFSKHTQGEKLQEGLKKWGAGRSSAEITDSLNNVSLKNHKHLVSSQESARKKARQFDSPVMQSAKPLTAAQQQQESIRFMDFLVQTKLDKYSMNTGVRAAAQTYRDAPQTVTDKTKALAQFEKEAESYIKQEETFNASVNLGYATSNICNQISVLTKNKDFGRFAQGIGAMTQFVDGIHKINQASAMISQATVASSVAQSAATTSSAAQTATASAASSSAVMANGATMISAVGMVISAGIMIYSLCSTPDDEEDGLGAALNMIHSTIMEMWLDTRRNFAIVFEKLDELDRKITEMERQNWKRFLASMKAIHYYGEMTREQLRDLKTTSHESLNYVHHGLESYLKTMIRADSRSVVAYIGKVGQAKTIERLTKHTNKLEQWLTQGAAIADYSGYIPTRHGKLNVTTQTLISLLKNAMAPEVSNDGSYPLGLYASIARSIDPNILSGENLTAIVNPQDWNRVLASYIEVIQSGTPLIVKETTASQQAFFIDEVRKIKQIPSLILNLLSDLQRSKKLWKSLVNDYSAAVQSLQAQVKQILEEKRQEFNEVYDLLPEQDILRLHESASENITRIQGEAVPESLKIHDPVAWLQTLNATYDSQYERPQLVWGYIHEHRTGWLGGDRATGQLGKLSAKQAEILYNKDKHFSQIIQDPYFLVAKKYKCIDVDLSCFHQNIQPDFPQQWDGHNTAYFTFSLRSKQLKKSFIQMNLYPNPSNNPGVGDLHGFDRPFGIDYSPPGGNGPRRMEVSLKRAISRHMKNKITERLEQEVLIQYRKSAGQIILTRVDFASLECASLKLFSFIKLLDPNFSIKLDSPKQRIQALITDITTSGSIESLQKLLNTTLDATLLSADLKYTLLSPPLSLNTLTSLLKDKVKRKPLSEHRLWQSMAHALASLEMLDQKLAQESKRHTSISREKLDETLSDAILKLVEHDQTFSDGLCEIQSIIANAKPLVSTGLLKEQDLEDITEQVTQLDGQFRIRVEETMDALNDSIDGEYKAPVYNKKPIEHDLCLALSPEKTAQLSKKWIESAQSSVTFSFQDTINLLEKVLAEVSSRRLTNNDASAVLFVGRTQVGKSTLANSLSGVTYEFMHDEFGRRRVRKSEQSVKNEFTKTGTGLSSETIFPKIKLESQLMRYLIDMPGYLDTRGEPQQISTGIAFQCLKSHCKTLKGIVIVCDENEFLNDGLVSLRTTLKNVEHILPQFTLTEKNHVVLAITKSRGEITSEKVLMLLRRLLATEYATATETDKLAVKQALLYLTEAPDRIVFVDVTNPNSVTALNEKINALPMSSMAQFNFSPSSTEISLMKQVLQTIINTKRELKESIHRLECILTMQLKKKLRSICIDISSGLTAHYEQLKASLSELDSSELDPFLEFTVLIEQQKDLIRQALVMTGTLNQLLNTKDASFSTIESDSAANELIEKYTEYKVNRDFFNRIIKIAQLFSFHVNEKLPQRSVNPTLSKDAVVAETAKQSTDKKYSPKPKTIPIIGDGNCLFRAISKALYNHENAHGRIRQLACDAINIDTYTALKKDNPGAYVFDIPDDLSPRRYVSLMRSDRVYAEGNAIIKALVTVINRPIHIRVGTLEGENKAMEHVFNPKRKTVELIDSDDLDNLQHIKGNSKTIHLWLISTTPPHYELLPKTSPMSVSGDSLDGYLTDAELESQLEIHTQDAILEGSKCVRTDERYWKKTDIRGQRVLKEDFFSSINLSQERHSFFNVMHEKKIWADMKITDVDISIILPLKLGKK